MPSLEQQLNATFDIARADMIFHVGTVIDRPADVVWSQFVDIESWERNLKTKRLAGEKGQVGEVRLWSVIVDGSEMQPHIVETIKLVRSQQAAYKMYSLEDADYGEYGPYSFTGFSQFNFREECGATIITLDNYVEFKSSKISGEQFKPWAEQLAEHARLRWDQAWLWLRERVEQR
jgi:hypothetical protein